MVAKTVSKYSESPNYDPRALRSHPLCTAVKRYDVVSYLWGFDFFGRGIGVRVCQPMDRQLVDKLGDWLSRRSGRCTPDAQGRGEAHSTCGKRLTPTNLD